MKKIMLRDIEVSALGMGCMGFSIAYGKIPEESESIRLMHKAHEMGCTFYDTADPDETSGDNPEDFWSLPQYLHLCFVPEK